MATRRSFLTSAAALLAASHALPASAFGALKEEMARTLSIVVGFPPGGSGDTMARLIGHEAQGKIASSVLVENRPGAGGRIAVAYVKDASPDGRTLLQAPASSLVIYPHIYRNLAYQPLKDFSPVARIASFEFALCVGPQVPESITSFQDFEAWSRTRSEPVTYASPAEGSTGHFAGLMIADRRGIPMVHVPYKGSAPAIQDTIGGHIAACCNVVSEVLPHIKDGRLRILATTGARRSEFLPEVPTLQELGMEGVVAQEYFALFAPANTPENVIEEISQVVQKAVASPAVSERLRTMGFIPDPSGPAALKSALEEDYQRWGTVISASGFKMIE
ncbi:MAG: Bug family tripartite tricarboxylate transporter substrate binding protein [Pigmentiphaga sp.]|nr:Bug family tripartite tricarboxylate transporter substrate binding protein [Pigmentiphaga sp.]